MYPDLDFYTLPPLKGAGLLRRMADYKAKVRKEPDEPESSCVVTKSNAQRMMGIYQ